MIDFDPKRYKGFSLLEVLIAIVVLSIGLLGLAGLQFSALRGNNQSYERSQANLLAYEIADVMRVNRVAAANDAFVMGPTDPPAAAPIDCTADECGTQAQTAAFALDQWFQRVTQVLPAGTARIRCEDGCGPGLLHTVQVMWDESREGLDPTDDDANACPPASVRAEDMAEDPPVMRLACVQISLVP